MKNRGVWRENNLIKNILMSTKSTHYTVAADTQQSAAAKGLSSHPHGRGGGLVEVLNRRFA